MAPIKFMNAAFLAAVRRSTWDASANISCFLLLDLNKPRAITPKKSFRSAFAKRIIVRINYSSSTGCPIEISSSHQIPHYNEFLAPGD